MKCPHCLESFHGDPTLMWQTSDIDGLWGISQVKCPACSRRILYLDYVNANAIFKTHKDAESSTLVRPKGTIRPISPEVPEQFAEDYREACVVLPDSPKASAALSRRCLQYLLREVAKVKKSDLADEIQQVIDSGKLPSHIAEAIDAIRNIGNFAAHPTKSKSTGEIVPVEPGEAEWNLEVLESLFDFYFVQPAVLKKKKEALNQKLKDAGKPEMK
jgi:hypothetical protein